ncbi:MAG: hypothetical protein ABI577_06810 [bacterium]
MRTAALLIVVVVAAILADGASFRVGRAEGNVEVTSVDDAGGAGGAICPHATLCTLRRAIEVANADDSGGEFRITFAPTVFPAANPATVEVGNTPLPNISRANVTIDAAGAGVSLANGASSLTAQNNGLTATGAGFSVFGLHIHGFPGSCVAVTGDQPTIGGPGAGNTVGGCKSGIAVSGLGAVIRSNFVGFTASGAEDRLATGIVVAAGDARVGGPSSIPGAGNTIGFSDTAVFVGAGGAQAFTGVQIERNLVGRWSDGTAAPVENGVVLSQPSSQTAVTSNTFANTGVAISVAPNVGETPVIRNRFTANIFDGIAEMAIDLGADGVAAPNDPGDSDIGANGLLNHPIITRATQTRVSGTACGGCQVQIYVAVHQPGAANDYGLAPLVSGTVTADASGVFALDNPAAGPGDWLIALATDADGNTSEFGPSARVGAGSVLCGNVQLQAGWNHVGYFGSEPVPLLSSFTPVPSGAVTAIYRFVDGTDQFERWLAATPAGRTLTTVQPGESYWFFAEAPATLPGGFSLSFPVPVQLKAGWNDLVYLGASETVADSLSSLGSNFHDLFHYDALARGWQRFGGISVPSWARQFDRLEACSVYQLRLDAPATLVPLQP